MGSKGLTFFAFMCLISAARADTKVAGPIVGIISLLIIGACIWCCCRCCRHETNVTVVSAGGGAGGGGTNTQNSFVVNMPTQPAMPQPCAPMPQQYTPMPHPPQYTN